MDLKLKDFEDQYIDQLIEVIFDAYKDYPEYGEPDAKSAKRYIKWLKKHSTLFKILFVNNEIAGFIVVDANWKDNFDGKIVGEIHEIAIKKKFWNRGLGKYLLNMALEHIKEKGREVARLWVGKKNKRAIEFYEKQGFKKLYERWNWVRMEKRL